MQMARLSSIGTGPAALLPAPGQTSAGRVVACMDSPCASLASRPLERCTPAAPVTRTAHRVGRPRHATRVPQPESGAGSKHDEDGIAPVLALEPNPDSWPAGGTTATTAEVRQAGTEYVRPLAECA